MLHEADQCLCAKTLDKGVMAADASKVVFQLLERATYHATYRLTN